jgi:hypothetical protein
MTASLPRKLRRQPRGFYVDGHVGRVFFCELRAASSETKKASERVSSEAFATGGVGSREREMGYCRGDFGEAGGRRSGWSFIFSGRGSKSTRQAPSGFTT